MVAKVPLTTKVRLELKQAAIKDAKKRGITLSKYVENSLIHELNKNGTDGTVHELEQIRDSIDERIKELKIDEKEKEELMESPIDRSVQDVDSLQRKFGYVTEGVVHRNAELAGLTFEEFLGTLKEYGIEIVIMK